LAQVNDKFTMIRSMSYTPVGLFNHTAAIYQMLTGYTADKVSPSGQLEPPTPKDFPNVGSNVVRIKPPVKPMLPFVMLPRPLQESNVVGKGGTAGFLGRAYDPYLLYPAGDDMDMTKMDRIKIDDLKLREETNAQRLERRASLRESINKGLPALEDATSKYALDDYYGKALSLVISGNARKAFELAQEPKALRERYGMNKFGQSCLLARRLVESGVRFINVTMGGWDTHANNFKTLKDRNLPTIDQSWSALLEDLQTRGMLDKTMVIWLGDFGRTPKINSAAGRDHWAGSTVFCMGGGGMKVGSVIGKSDANAEQPVTPPIQIEDIAATLYTILGIPVDKHYVAPDGRPFRINLNGKVVNEILA
jgi:hypothetical protein